LSGSFAAVAVTGDLRMVDGCDESEHAADSAVATLKEKGIWASVYWLALDDGEYRALHVRPEQFGVEVRVLGGHTRTMEFVELVQLVSARSPAPVERVEVRIPGAVRESHL
jgi:hypothetical protein